MSKQEKWEYNQMMKKSKRESEQQLNLKSEFDISDPTPMLAIRNIIEASK